MHKVFSSDPQNGHGFVERHVIGTCCHNTRILGQPVTLVKFSDTNTLVEVFCQKIAKLASVIPAFLLTSDGIFRIVSVSRLSSSHVVAFTRRTSFPF